MYCNVQMPFVILILHERIIVLKKYIGNMILMPGVLFWDLMSH